ncbi:MAG: hypothetical protein JKX81_16345 [Arenicella sp.]|nr:hypothetical protein [Arenicella sp.]
MATPSKKPNPAGLIAIANPALAKKLNDNNESSKNKVVEQAAAKKPTQLVTFDQDRWRAVLTLNILRYGLALFLLAMSSLPSVFDDFHASDHLIHPSLFKVSAIAMLVSAVCFTVFTSKRVFELKYVLISQFSVDIVLAGLLTHAAGSISSNFILLFFVVVTTGSVVLRRKPALALASGATIIMLYEHLYSSLKDNAVIDSKFDTLALYCLTLMFAAWGISYIASRLRHAELKSFIPGNESIEEYLVREEKVALKAALESTNGNKTEAAKLLGMTFRSFRYKLTKYELG